MGEHKLPRNQPVEDTGWKKPTIVTDGGETKGVIQPATGLEKNPCFACRSFEKDERRLRQHCQANGLVPDAEGFYITPIAQEIQGRKSLRLNPADCGWCRRHGSVSHMNATCPDFVATATREELALKLRRGWRG